MLHTVLLLYSDKPTFGSKEKTHLSFRGSDAIVADEPPASLDSRRAGHLRSPSTTPPPLTSHTPPRLEAPRARPATKAKITSNDIKPSTLHQDLAAAATTAASYSAAAAAAAVRARAASASTSAFSSAAAAAAAARAWAASASTSAFASALARLTCISISSLLR